MLAPVALALCALALAHGQATPATVTAAPAITQVAVLPDPAATEPLRLTAYHVPYPQIPVQMNPYATGRGPQSGTNQCSSATEGADGECQTLLFNSISEFCLWGSPTAGASVGDVEAAAVSYCTKPGMGGRVLPAGAISGLQWMRTSAYVQVTGFVSLEALGFVATDTGGELDPHGADQMGNPLGGLVYSNATDAWPFNVDDWTQFLGSGPLELNSTAAAGFIAFGLKACFNGITSPNYCENRYDILGAEFNMPAAFQNGAYLACDGDLQDVVGQYTSDGVVQTWSQPASIAAGSVLPWTPRVPASSNCVSYASAELFAGGLGTTPAGTAVVSTTSTPAAMSTPATTSQMLDFLPTAMSTGAAASSRTGSSAAASSTSSTAGAAPRQGKIAGHGAIPQVLGSLAVAAFTIWALI